MTTAANVALTAPQDDEDDVTTKPNKPAGGVYRESFETIAAAHDRQVDAFMTTLSDAQKSKFVDPLAVTQSWGPGGSNFKESAAIVDSPEVKAFEGTLTPAQKQQYEDLKNPNPPVRRLENGVETVVPATQTGGQSLSSGFNAQSNPQMAQLFQMLAQLMASLLDGKNGFDFSKLFGGENPAGEVRRESFRTPVGKAIDESNAFYAGLSPAQKAAYPGALSTMVAIDHNTPDAQENRYVDFREGKYADDRKKFEATLSPDQRQQWDKITADAQKVFHDEHVVINPDAAQPALEARERKDHVAAQAYAGVTPPEPATPTVNQWTAQPGGALQYDAGGSKTGAPSTSDKLTQTGVFAGAFNNVQETQIATAARVADPTATPAVWTPVQPGVRATQSALG